MSEHPTLWKGLLVGALAGLAAAWLKSLAEPPLQRLSEQVWPVTPAGHGMVGADPTHHQDNMPPAVLLDHAEERLAGHPLSRDQKLKGQQMIHYVMGAGLGAVYGALAEVAPGVTRGLGVPAGAVLYALTHGSGVPATGVQAWPWQLPRAAVAWESGSHLVYGAGLEVLRRLLRPRLG